MKTSDLGSTALIDTVPETLPRDCKATSTTVFDITSGESLLTLFVPAMITTLLASLGNVDARHNTCSALSPPIPKFNQFEK